MFRSRMVLVERPHPILSRLHDELLALLQMDMVWSIRRVVQILLATLLVVSLPLLGLAFFLLLPLVGTGIALYVIMADVIEHVHLRPHH